MARILQSTVAQGPFVNEKGKVIYHEIATDNFTNANLAKAHASMIAAREAYAKAKATWEKAANATLANTVPEGMALVWGYNFGKTAYGYVPEKDVRKGAGKAPKALVRL